MESDRVESASGVQIICPPCSAIIPDSPVQNEVAVAAAVKAGWKRAPNSDPFQTYVCPECYQQLYAD